MVFLGNQHSML